MAALRSLAATLLVALALPAAAAAQAPEVLSDGHIDVGPFWAGGDLRLQVKEGGEPARYLDFDDVVLRIGPEGRIRVPASGTGGREWEYVGDRGDHVWRLPEDAEAGLLWAGFGNADQTGLDRHLAVQLRGVSGPGEVLLWSLGADAPFWSTRSGLPMARTATGHAHMGWYLTEPGVYCLTFGAVGRRALGGERLEAQDQLTIVTATDAAGQPIDASSVVPCSRRPGPAPIAPVAPVPHAGQGGVPTVASDGRYELRPTVVGDSLEVPLVRVSGRDRGAIHRAEDVVFHVRGPLQSPTASWQSPDGTPVPQLRPGYTAPALGWSTTRLEAQALDGDLSWRLVDVSGPGAVTVDDEVSRGLEDRPVLAAEAAPYALWPGYTSEGTWSFSAPGVYCVTTEWTGTSAAGAQVSATQALTFLVDPPSPESPATDPADLVPCGRSPEEAARRVLDTGHVDVAARVLDGQLELSVGDGSTGNEVVHRAATAVTLAVRDAARRTVPQDPAFRFLGAPGAPVWVLPQTQDPDLLWPGWSTESIPSGTLRGAVQWTLLAARGPGHVALWSSAALAGAPSVRFNTRDGLPDIVDVPLGTHAHGNWAFSAPGVYCLDVAFSGTYRSGRALHRAATILVAVGGDATTAGEQDCVTGPPPDGAPPDAPPPGPPADAAPRPTPPDSGRHAVVRLAIPQASRRLSRILARRAIRARCTVALPGRCVVVARLAGRRGVRLGRATATYRAPGAKTLRIPIGARARAALRRAPRPVRLRLVARATAANATGARDVVVLRVRGRR